MAMTCADCLDMYNVFKESGKVMFIGQQRLYDPKYIKAMEMIHAGLLGEINSIRAYWFRNNDWRRPSLLPIWNVRSTGVYIRNIHAACNRIGNSQLQVGTGRSGLLPEKVAAWGISSIGRMVAKCMTVSI